MALVSGISLDPEAAIGVTKRPPPKWVDGVDEVSSIFSMMLAGLSRR
uniref:Syntaxin 16 n=1 Tax=Homo sapiens TaxID=9606 RepID=E9PLV7_HUMAN